MDFSARRICAAILCGALAQSAWACSVAMPLERIADHAGQVVVGTVEQMCSYWAEGPRRIETEVVLADVEFLKGGPAHASARFRLVVPGGSVGEVGMRLCCAPQFSVGDKWMLFLLGEYRVHPVVGMGVGAFRVVVDANGVERVYQSGDAVSGFDDDGFVTVVRQLGTEATPRVIADGNVRVAQREADPAARQGISFEEFRSHVQPILERSSRIALVGGAPRRISVDFRAVPLRFAEGRVESVVRLRGLGAVREVASRRRPADKHGRAGESAKP